MGPILEPFWAPSWPEIGSKSVQDRFQTLIFQKTRFFTKPFKINCFRRFFRPKMASKMLQDRPKTVSRRSWIDVFFASIFASIFGRFLVRFWLPFGALLGAQIGHFVIDFLMIFACRSKIAPRAAKSRPRAAKSLPRASQERPREAQERPRAAKKAPRAAKSHPRGPKSGQN